MTIAHDAHPSTRVTRGLKLYRDRGHAIERTGPSTYRIPSCFGDGSYLVDVRATFCTCPDHRRAKALGEACKHRIAAEIAHSKRRTA